MTPWIGERADAVIFDHDGTLVDSETITLSLLATMAVEAGAELYPDDATRFMGSDISVVIDEIEVRSGTTVNREAFFAEFRERQYEEIRTGLVEIVGATQLLEALSERQVPFAVATNAPMAKMELCLATTGLDRFFSPDTMVSAYDVGVWKPDPAVFIEAAKRLNTSIERCAIVEDSRPGVQAALASGGHAIALDPNGHFEGSEAHRVEGLDEANRLLLGASPQGATAD